MLCTQLCGQAGHHRARLPGQPARGARAPAARRSPAARCAPAQAARKARAKHARAAHLSSFLVSRLSRKETAEPYSCTSSRSSSLSSLDASSSSSCRSGSGRSSCLGALACAAAGAAVGQGGGAAGRARGRLRRPSMPRWGQGRACRRGDGGARETYLLGLLVGLARAALGLALAGLALRHPLLRHPGEPARSVPMPAAMPAAGDCPARIAAAICSAWARPPQCEALAAPRAERARAVSRDGGYAGLHKGRAAHRPLLQRRGAQGGRRAGRAPADSAPARATGWPMRALQDAHSAAPTPPGPKLTERHCRAATPPTHSPTPPLHRQHRLASLPSP